jgi:vacuolar-type H+-ATPase subunit I/STV1
MKLGVIVNNRQVIDKLVQPTLPGDKALKLRRAIKQYRDELQHFDDEKNSYIQKYGKDNAITPDMSEAFEGIMKLMNEMAESEAQIKTGFVLSDEDIKSMEFSVQDIDSLVALGLYKENGTGEK